MCEWAKAQADLVVFGQWSSKTDMGQALLDGATRAYFALFQ
jgi:hypothetical protein